MSSSVLRTEKLCKSFSNGGIQQHVIKNLDLEIDKNDLDAYEAALKIELEKVGCKVRTQVYLPMIYDGIKVEKAYRIDMLVEDKVIVELKAVSHMNEIWFKQLMTYLKMTGLKLGLLVNFETENIEKSIYRRVNGL